MPDDRSIPPADLPGRAPAEVLRGVEAPRTPERVVLQEFAPLPQGLETKLARTSWDEEGVRPFVGEAVPYAVNNSGWAADAAARILFRAAEADPAGRPLRALELGAGLGLFARLLLDRFAALCAEAGTDHHRRLTLYVTDASPATVEAWRAAGLFEGHEGRVVTSVVDAAFPGRLLRPGRPDCALELEPGSLTAVFANYVLDTLPLDVVRRGADGWERLEVRTSVAGDDIDAAERAAGVSLAEIARGVAAPAALIEYLTFETRFAPAPSGALPGLDLLEEVGAPARAMLNHGAIAALDAAIGLLRADGFLLVNDFGPTRVEDADGLAYVSRFGRSLAAALHFPLLEAAARRRGFRTVAAPGDADRTIHARLFLSAPQPAVETTFVEIHADPAFLRADGAVHRATAHVVDGRHDLALAEFRDAVEAFPGDWTVLGQAAQFLNQQLLRHEDALELARAALAIQPWFSPLLWNTYGNCLFCLGRLEEATRAYDRARAIHPGDAQAWMNLAWVHAAERRPVEALEAIARGLRNDREGRFRSSLLQKQDEILRALDEERDAEERRRLRRHDVLSGAR